MKDSMGFTLLELIVVTAIMALVVFTVAPIFTGRDDQARFGRTQKMLAEIQRAVLGDFGDLGMGRVRLAGYVPDMGALPALQVVPGGSGTAPQPRGLWTPDLDADGEDDLVGHTLFIDDYWAHYFQSPGHPDTATAAVSLGWRGSYIEAPRDGVLRDGWGNPIVFEANTPDDGDLTVKSLGADGNPGGAGHGADITVTIERSRYLADVAGYVAHNSFDDHTQVTVALYFAPPDPPYAPGIKPAGGATVPQPRIKDLKAEIQKGVGKDGYFLFKDVPVGRERILKISERVELNGDEHWSLMFHRLYVLPGGNWLGTIEMETIYEAP
jgi:type II secretory pathway pseudopilin PulG